MRYIPTTEAERQAMLAAIGVESVDDLLAAVPARLRATAAIGLPPGEPEPDLMRRLKALADRNGDAERVTSFLGAGVYPHLQPAVVPHLALRAEFLTSYTPYQPEVAQGTLQAIFEFQTMVAALFGMELANASMYDGSTALAEAVLMARRVTKRDRILLARSLHPEYREVVRTYARQTGLAFEELPWGSDGTLDPGRLPLDERVAAVVVGYPNFLGVIEPLPALAEAAHRVGALLVTSTPEPVALGLLKGPGALGADIATGEGQAFGVPPGFGGPHVGLFATRERFLRQMPGRLVGETVDAAGKRGYVLTLSTREQHIRREQATSNICTNSGLVALMVTVYLAALGRHGLARLARQNYARAEYARSRLAARGLRLPFAGPTFNEFVVETRQPAAEVVRRLAREGLVPGLALARFYPELPRALLVCVTEQHPREAIDRLVAGLAA
ncbi:MAG TPA: aminomethyl-transferring glycine dehydrogenase subunit GcvPA [Thermodesulfobacteriota bacterium]|nr:aminomethyl-transferring glycine dehydrogenase subunit GcvPA [Thermodesulfobacteriota bacterium]